MPLPDDAARRRRWVHIAQRLGIVARHAAEAAGDGRFVDNEHPAGLGHRVDDGLGIQRL